MSSRSYPEEQTCRELAKKYGTFIRLGRHGEIFEFLGGARVGFPSMKSKGSNDQRAWKNTLANVRRSLREAGVSDDRLGVRQREVDVQEEVEVSDLSDRMESLGIYVDEQVKIVERKTLSVVLTKEALASLFVEVTDVSSVELTDEGEGREVEGPMTLRVTVEVERDQDGLAVPQAKAG